jgi:hypothetical protein
MLTSNSSTGSYGEQPATGNRVDVKEVVVRDRDPMCLALVPWAGPAEVIWPQRLVDDGWLLRVPLTVSGGRSTLLPPLSPTRLYSLRASTEHFRLESPAGSVVRRLAFEPSEPWLSRDSVGAVCLKARYRGPQGDRLFVVPAGGCCEQGMREGHRFESFGYFEARVPDTSGALSLKVVADGGQAWWTPITGLGSAPKTFHVPAADGGARPATTPRLVQERRIGRAVCFHSSVEPTLWIAPLNAEIFDLLRSGGRQTGPVFVRLRDLLPSAMRLLLGGATLPLFCGTEEILTLKGVDLVASGWRQAMERVLELARLHVVDGLVVDWADQLRPDLLDALFALACIRDGSVEMVVDGAWCQGPHTRGQPSTSAGRTYWPFVDQLSAHLGEAWLRMRPEAFHGWRPEHTSVTGAHPPAGTVIRAQTAVSPGPPEHSPA